MWTPQQTTAEYVDPHGRSLRGEPHLQLQLVPQRDAVRPRPRDLRLESLPATVHRTGADQGQVEPPSLVEPQRIDVVVRRDHPQTSATRLPGDLLDGSQQCGAHALLPSRDVQ